MLNEKNMGLTANNEYDANIYFNAFEMYDGRIKLKRFMANEF